MLQAEIVRRRASTQRESKDLSSIAKEMLKEALQIR